VSVVVPVRDRRVLLAACLDGLAAQTYTDFEVVVADDGSTDGSGDEAAARGARVVRVAGEGAVEARRAGVRAAVGSVLAFTDSDCVPRPGWLAAGVAAIDGGADMVQGRTVPARPPAPGERTMWVEAEDPTYPSCNVFYRRDAYDRAGGFDPAAGDRLGYRHGSDLRGLGFGEDTLLGWAVRRAGTVTFEPRAEVAHAVFPLAERDALTRAWATGGFPALVREVPELRDELWGRLLLGGPSRLALYGAVAALAIRRPLPAAALAVVWAAMRARPIVRWEPRWRRRARVLALDLATEAINAAALVTASIRTRSVVL
jgi:hypothetical protein